jgi:hypothetical protein
MSTRPSAPREKVHIDWSEWIRKIAALLTRYGAMGFILCFGYFIYAIFGGVLQSADPQRAMGLISTFGTGLLAASFCLALGVVLLTLDELAYTMIVGVVGAALMLGMPYLVASNLSSNVAQGMQAVVGALSGYGTQSGLVVLVVVGCRVLFEIVLQLRDAPQRRRDRTEKATAEDQGILKTHKTIKPPSVISRCWELPFCSDRIREICPAFKARKACWRYGIGCNCDPKMIESLIRMGQPGHGPQSAEMKGRQAAYVRADLQADIVVGDKAQRTIACAKCPIYNEHQRLKFKFVNPVAIIATFVTMGVLYVPIMAGLTMVAKGIADVAANISLGQGVTAAQWFEYLNEDGVKVFFFIILSLLALSYILKFTEWVVLEKKL